MAEVDERKMLDEAAKLPMAERVGHSNWKVRVAAYEEIKKDCDKAFDENDPILNDHVMLFSKAVSDSNANAADKALDALLSFLGRASVAHASRIAEKTLSNMVAKCLGLRPATLVKVSELVLLLVELEQGLKVQEQLIIGFSHKVPKQGVVAMDIAMKAVSSFGPKVVPPQPFLKALPPYFDSKDSNMRAKVKELVVELARWVGPEVVKASLFEKMRDAMREDIEKLLQEAPAGRPKPERLTRSEQAKAAASRPEATSADVASTSGGAVQEEALPPEVDAYDFVDPKNILGPLGKEFWDGLESGKWAERKGSLTALKDSANFPKLQSGDYGDVNRELRKIITKDNNVACVSEAIACTANLAKGLRKEYRNTAMSLCSVLIEKFKDKSSAVNKAAYEALSVMQKYCFGLLDVMEDVTAGLSHQNPKVREEVMRWMVDSLANENKQNITKLAAAVLPPAVKCAEDAVPSLRETSLNFLVTFAVKAASFKVLEKHIVKLDDGRKKKLEDMFEQARQTMGAASVATAQRPASASIASSPAPKPAAPTRPKTAAPARSGAPTGKAPSATPAKKVSAGGKKDIGGDGEDESVLSSGVMHKDDCILRFTELVGEGTVAELQESQWKTRLDAMERVLQLAAQPGMSEHSTVLVQAMQYVPGWDEKNFQVMGKQFELVKLMANDAPGFTKRDGYVAILGLMEKLSDIKLKGVSFDTLLSISEAVGPQFVLNLLHKKAAVHKNPKILSEALNFTSSAVQEFGLQAMNVKLLLDWVKEDLGSTNAGVRNSAINLLGVMHGFLGPVLGDMVRNDVKPALMTAIEGEFAKNPQLTDFAPTRISRVETSSKASRGGAGGKAGKGSDGGGAGPLDMSDLIPRQDISNSITPALITLLASSNWKERKQGLEDVEGVLSAAGNRITPNTGELMPALKARIGDSNKNLAVLAMQVFAKICKAMGKPIDRHGRPVLSASVKNIGDAKPNVRSAVVEVLDAWASVAPVEALFDELLTTISSPKCCTDGRADALLWMATIVSAGNAGGCGSDGLKCAVLGSQDKTVEVREAASKLLGVMIDSFGLPEIEVLGSQLEGPQKKAAQEAITKVSGVAVNLSAVVAPSSAPSSRPSTSSMRASTTRPTTAGSSGVRASKVGGLAGSKGPVVNKSINLSAATSSADLPPISIDTKKDERAKRLRFKPSKFELRPDEAQTLEAEITPLLSPHMKGLMWHKDFKKHCEAIDLVRDRLGDLYDALYSILDLFFRWCVLRIVEQNTQVLVKMLDMLSCIVEAMLEQGHRMSELESKILLPALVEKCGHNQDRIKNDFKEAIRKCALIFPPQKVVMFVKDGLESKNNRSRVLCAELIGSLIDQHGPSLYRGPKQTDLLGMVARLVSERDNTLRGAALVTLEVVYSIEADGIWKHIGKLTDQQRSLIEERFKYTDKELAKHGLRPGHRADEFSEEVPSTPCVAQLKSASPGPAAAAAVQHFSPPVAEPVYRSSPPAVQAMAAYGGAVDASYDAGIPPQSTLAAMAMVGDPNAGAGMLAASLPLASSLDASSRHAGSGSSPSLNAMGKRSDEEIRASFQELMARIAGSDLNDVVEAMKVLCYELMEMPKMSRALQEMVTGSTDHLVSMLVTRTEQIFSSASYAISIGDAPNLRACRYALNTLMQIFQVPAMPSRIPKQTQRHLITIILSCLLEESISSLPDGEALMKALNVLMLKILDNCNRTTCYSTLIALLLEPHSRVQQSRNSAAAEARWYDLVVKCLIKITKSLPATVQTVDVSELLLSIHMFFTNLGVEEIRRRGAREDKPLRMVKTILHELCKLLGADIYCHTTIIPGHDSEPTLRPIIFPYIDLNLQTLVPDQVRRDQNQVVSPTQVREAAAAPSQGGYGTTTPPPPLGVPAAAPPGASNPPSPKMPLVPSPIVFTVKSGDDQGARNALAAIFKRIGDKKHAEQALVDLHFFMERHPQVDVNSFLSAASDNFKNYIIRGLNKVRQALANQGGDRTDAALGLNMDQISPGPAPSYGESGPASPERRRIGPAGLAELRDRINRIQGDIATATSNMRSSQERNLQELQERMKRLTAGS